MSKQLYLIDPPADQPAPEKKAEWDVEYVGIYWYGFKEARGRNPKLGYGTLRKMLKQYAEKHWVNETTGELEVPAKEDWETEIKWYFRNVFAAKERGFDFAYFLKGFGTFEKYDVQKRSSETDLMLTKVCNNCQHEMKYPRSFWVKSKNKVGRCSKCNTGFNVNDVLNQIPALNNILPLVTGASNDTNTHQ